MGPGREGIPVRDRRRERRFAGSVQRALAASRISLHVRARLLINNAGISLQNDLSDRAALEGLLAVNLFGTYDATHAFLPVLARSRSAIVNVLSLASIAAVPFDSLYSISKAAAFSLSQSLRALLAGRGISVYTVLPGPLDTDMSRNLDIPKASPESTAQAILDGVEKEDEEIFPDPMSEAIAEGWRSSAVKALQRQFAAYVAQTPIKSSATLASMRR